MPPDNHAALLRSLRPYTGRITVLLLLVTMQSIASVAPALVGQQLIDQGILGRDSSVVWTLAGALAVLGLAQAGLLLLERRFATRLAEDVALHLREELFTHLQRQSHGFFTASRTGAIVSRVQSDLAGLRKLIATTLPVGGGAVVLLVVSGAVMLAVEWRLAVAALLLVPMMQAITSRLSRALQRVGRQQLTAQAELDALVGERLSPGGAEVIRNFSSADRELAAFRTRALQVRDVSVSMSVLSASLAASVILVMSLITAAAYLVAGQLAVDGSLSVGSVVALVALMARVYSPLAAFSAVRSDLVAGLVAFSRIREVLEFVPSIAEPARPRPLPRRPAAQSYSITFQGVHFSYPPSDQLVVSSLGGQERPASGAGDQAALLGVDFTADPGATVGVVGLSGSGKSTLARLLNRTWDVTAGRILIGGTDVRALSLEDVRSSVGVVTQDTFLFHDTIRANLLIARPQASTDELMQACRDALVLPVVERLPDGLDTVIGDQGLRLSGGERQRLSLARVLLKAPPIVVLDEASSHYDALTEQELHRSLRRFLAPRTCVVIAHRLSMVREADLILVIRGGRVVERGTHAELIRVAGCYARLHRAQQGTV
ncbi:ABC transporter ATP-binding protein [Streptomyces sp. NPDC001920]